MKPFNLLGTLLFAMLSFIVQSGEQEQFSAPPGPYLGQTPPGFTPEVFAPGIVSTEHRGYSGFFTPDMQEFYFTRKDKNTKKWWLITFKNEMTEWRGAIVGLRIGRPVISPDGATTYLGKQYMKRDNNAWSEPQSPGMFDREDWGIMRLTASSSGIYIFDDYKNGDVIRISTLTNGVRQPPEIMSSAINTGRYTAHPFVAPDETWLILTVKERRGLAKQIYTLASGKKMARGAPRSTWETA